MYGFGASICSNHENILKIALKSTKISSTFLFLLSNKMFAMRAGIHKMFERIENRKEAV